jgi:hypothetical protein
MPGTATKNFDLVIEFAESALRDLIGVAFDTDGFLCTLLDETINQIPGVNIPCGAFTLDILFDRPTDISIPANATSPVDIQLGLGDSGSLGSLRIVVGLDVDRSSDNFDIVQLNFKNKLYAVAINLVSIPVPAAPIETWLQNKERLPLIPTPVNRSTTDPKSIKRADAVIIDDTSPTDLDALAWCLTFGGGSPGQLEDFTQSFVPDGGNGAIAIFFDWLCRIISPLIINSLELEAGSFENCKLNKSQTIKDGDGDDVKLTKLELSLKDGFIEIKAAVEKDGTCYTAKGSVTARLRMEIVDGRLVVESEVDDPDIDIDIPWYCWLAAAIVGALTGGLLFGVIGAIVGAVIGPIIMYIVSEVIEGTVENIADNVVEAINDVSPEIDVPAVGINLVFDRVFIDDITIACIVAPIDRAPVRTSGIIVLRNGQFLDLDNGKVGDKSLVGADLTLSGSGDGRKIESVCITEIARTGNMQFDQSRFRLYNYFYQTPAAIPLSEVGMTIDLIFFELFIPTLNVYAVRTNENRYAVIQVVRVEDDYIRIRYKTFEKYLPTVEIQGNFRCLLLKDPVDIKHVEYIPHIPPLLASDWEDKVVDAVLDRAYRFDDIGVPEQARLKHLSVVRNRKAVSQDVLQRQFLRLAPDIARVGKWLGEYEPTVEMTGRFDAITDGLTAPLEYHWWVNRTPLSSGRGTVDVGGLAMRYEVSGARLLLKATKKQPVTAEIRVAVDDANGYRAETARCFEYKPKCLRRARVIPTWNIYREAYMLNFGIRESKIAAMAVPIEKTNIQRRKH